MNLPKERRKALSDAYCDLSEELHIFFRALRNEGFTSEDAMRILCAIVGRPDNFLGEYEYRRTKRENIDVLREHLKRQKEDKEKENGTDLHKNDG